jgi:hypothetical protein
MLTMQHTIKGTEETGRNSEDLGSVSATLNISTGARRKYSDEKSIVLKEAGSG